MKINVEPIPKPEPPRPPPRVKRSNASRKAQGSVGSSSEGTGAAPNRAREAGEAGEASKAAPTIAAALKMKSAARLLKGRVTKKGAGVEGRGGGGGGGDGGVGGGKKERALKPMGEDAVDEPPELRKKPPNEVSS